MPWVIRNAEGNEPGHQVPCWSAGEALGEQDLAVDTLGRRQNHVGT